ncbi:MAG: hypothetical protein HUU33_13795, partial [Flavobacteriales bacterium]|nr:hypothetical protein [Flavobacteriales bacterium]
HEILAGGASPPAAARKSLSRIFRADPGLGFGVSRALGFLLGERLYQALMEGHLTKLEIAALFRDPLAKRGSPARLYRQLRRRTGAVAPHFRSKDEFF